MAMEVPSNQQIDRTASGYRIPSSVFERSETNTPTDWSVASNESLFSIQGANKSIKIDSFLFRSGVLHALEAAETPSMKISDQKQMTMMMFSCPSSAHPTDKRSTEMGIAEAESTMKEVIKESEAAGNQSCVTTEKPHHHSHGSNISITSCAFSSQTGDAYKADSSSAKSRQAEVQEQSDQSQPNPENETEAYDQSDQSQPNPEKEIVAQDQSDQSQPNPEKQTEVQEQSDQSQPKPEKEAETTGESKVEAETEPSKETPTKKAPNRWKWFPCLP